jgi:NADPH2:quinone reductase
LRQDLGHVLELVRDGAITPQIAARFGLDQAAEALRIAEAGGNTGKVLILP